MGIISTEKDKRKVLVSHDNVKRLRRLGGALRSIVDNSEGPPVLCVESMSFPRNASSAAKVAMAWGLIVALDLPIVQRSPQEVKQAVEGNKAASKARVEMALTARFPVVPALLSGVPKSRWEHPVDALAVVVACLDDPLIQALSSHDVRKA
jgi:Holliday junction resolvasome RuvABC endonuclease subunit